jgi:hypothetical protein
VRLQSLIVVDDNDGGDKRGCRGGHIGIHLSSVTPNSPLRPSQNDKMTVSRYECMYMLIPIWAQTLFGNGESPNGNFLHFCMRIHMENNPI